MCREICLVIVPYWEPGAEPGAAGKHESKATNKELEHCSNLDGSTKRSRLSATNAFYHFLKSTAQNKVKSKDTTQTALSLNLQKLTKKQKKQILRGKCES